MNLVGDRMSLVVGMTKPNRFWWAFAEIWWQSQSARAARVRFYFF